MMDAADWQIPPSVIENLERLPHDRPIVFLIRHSVREDLPDGSAAYSLPITECGIQLGRQLGSLLGKRLCSLHTSPLNRCVQTAEALQVGAGSDFPITSSRLLGDPGAYVIDGKIACLNWEKKGYEGMMTHLVSATEALPGMARPVEAARFLVCRMLAIAGDRPGIHVFVTHDSLVAPTAAHLLNIPLGVEDWPWYLEGAFFWHADNQVYTAYRSYQNSCEAGSLCILSEGNIN
ncbi:histidine phosphatase family protein [Maridesulfovibrio hydrothermalis]|uniref:Phosphoglycerate mutase n=1 Tax=Maridesulfovibrio hydrothermalis AM13 = DSM 14728 TaxID=1121451 RepID=L0R7S6_9BACT